ncbi:MAG: hypothetical protein O3C57_08080 [Verrucomicrobia bacterium]|nr:hypothetical protein [Verrucomicrobiota bacterium]
MRKRPRSTSRIAAAFRLFIVISAAIGLAAMVAARMISVGPGSKNKAVMIAVADIHRSQPALSVISTNYAEVSRGLGVFEFDIRPDQDALFDGAVLRGGSTKQLMGHEVVYMRLTRDPAEPAVSLLVWPKREFFKRITSASRDVRGIRVDMWTDQTRVFARVRDLSP